MLEEEEDGVRVWEVEGGEAEKGKASNLVVEGEGGNLGLERVPDEVEKDRNFPDDVDIPTRLHEEARFVSSSIWATFMTRLNPFGSHNLSSVLISS